MYAIATPESSWFMFDYGNDWFGLKAGDGVPRGVPEGSRAQWLELIEAMRIGGEMDETRLAYAPEPSDDDDRVGVFSPRNTNYLDECFPIHGEDGAELLRLLLDTAQTE